MSPIVPASVQPQEMSQAYHVETENVKAPPQEEFELVHARMDPRLTFGQMPTSFQ